LDEQLNVLQMLKASSFVKPLLKSLLFIQSKIVLIQDTLEGWVKCQRS